MTLFPDLTIGIGKIRFAFLDVDFCDVKHLFVAMGRQACYERSCDKPRKDLFRPKGIIDPFLSLLFKRKYKVPINHKDDLTPHCDSQVVGCTITNDRRFAAGFVETPDCRFCSQTKECLSHIVHDCSEAPAALRACLNHDLGVNYPLLGICEHPVSIIDHRLQFQALSGEAVCFDPSLDVQEVWTDGSVVLQESFWLTAAGFAVVGSQGQCIVSGRVQHVALSAYAAELYGVLQAILHCNHALIIWTDCQTVVDQFKHLTHHNRVGDTWSHRAWWSCILDVWRDRSNQHSTPVSLQWMKAHSFDGTAPHLLTDAMASSVGLTRQQILCNQKADSIAKQHAWSGAPINPQSHTYLLDQIFSRQFQH